MHQTLPLIAILRGIRPTEIDGHLPPLIAAGFQTVEIPLNSPDWPQSIVKAIDLYGDRLTIGAGTVTDVASVRRLAELGCRLMLSPESRPEVIREALRCRMQVFPGCATPTEAFTSVAAGAQQLKLFPARQLGPGYVRALKAVLPAPIAIWAVGGITPDNLANFLAAGCTGAGLGSELYRAGQTPEQTATRAAAFVQAWHTYQTERREAV